MDLTKGKKCLDSKETNVFERFVRDNSDQNVQKMFCNPVSLLERQALENKDLSSENFEESKGIQAENESWGHRQQSMLNRNLIYLDDIPELVEEENVEIKFESLLEKTKLYYQSNETKGQVSVPATLTTSDENVTVKEDILEEAALPRFTTEVKVSEEDIKKPIHKSNKYSFIRIIGKGNFGVVKLARHLATDKLVAIKVIDKRKLNTKILSKIAREVSLLKELTHPNIVQLLEVMEDKTTLYLVMEYASGGELSDYLVHGCMREKEARIKFREMISAVHYCHRKGIVHRDLTAENILLNHNLEIKIADFGFANKFQLDSTLDTFCGSPLYAAPELFLGKKYVGPEVDIWSLGVILFTLVSGRLPFDAGNFADLRQKVVNIRFEVPYFISNHCENLLRKMLVVNTQDRASIDVILGHPWVEGGGLPKMNVFTDEEFVICNERVKHLKEMGFQDVDIISTFKQRKFNAIHATYELLKQTMIRDNVSYISKQTSSYDVQSTVDKIFIRNHNIEIKEDTKVEKEAEKYSLMSGVAFLKTLKNWFFNSVASTEIPQDKNLTDHPGNSLKETHRPSQSSIPQGLRDFGFDPTSSITKGPNQQAILATLNQMSLTKHQKAGMFQSQTIGSQNARQTIDKNPNTPRIVSIKHQSEATAMGKFMVESVVFSQATIQSPTPITNIRSSRSEVDHDESVRSEPYKSENRRKSKMVHQDDTCKSELIAAKDQSRKNKTDVVIKISDKSEKLWRIFDSKCKPRTANFAFSVNTISSKNADDIMFEIIHVLEENEFFFEFLEKYLLLCWLSNKQVDIFGDSIQWEMEVCRIKVLFKNGIRMNRIFGSAFAYKKVVSKISKLLHL